MPTKCLKKKCKRIMFNGSNCDRKSQLSGVLAEPLNPRAQAIHRSRNPSLYRVKKTVIIISANPPLKE